MTRKPTVGLSKPYAQVDQLEGQQFVSRVETLTARHLSLGKRGPRPGVPEFSIVSPEPNCMLDMTNATIRFMVDSYAREPGQFNPLVEKDAVPNCTKLEGTV